MHIHIECTRPLIEVGTRPFFRVTYRAVSNRPGFGGPKLGTRVAAVLNDHCTRFRLGCSRSLPFHESLAKDV